ncbi:MAG: uroporphyrinogen decarboxylase family protein [Deltaproteobacteria bacterium]|nr:uroporphyrinogen decarboxylase family protein [Deltaproteobacteria bacterium]
MTSSQRLQEALSFHEPDRVPYALGATLHMVREMGLSQKEYFSDARHLVEGQLRLRQKFGNDILSCYPAAAVEMLAWGGEIRYFDQGPPNAGPPIIRQPGDILALAPPTVEDNPPLATVLEATRALRARVGDEVPIAGVVISPFSLPIMQMGFENYIDLIYERPALLPRLLQVNTAYCVRWANAQLKAGAASILCSDPALSPTIFPRDIVLRHGLPSLRNLIDRIEGAVVVHLASGRGLSLVDEIAGAGAVGMSASAEEDLGDLKAACQGRLGLVGNLNALDMVHWSPEKAEEEVKKALAAAGPGGGFVLSDNHGEIPLLVSEEVLLAVVAAVRRWGKYPLAWVAAHGA